MRPWLDENLASTRVAAIALLMLACGGPRGTGGSTHVDREDRPSEEAPPDALPLETRPTPAAWTGPQHVVAARGVTLQYPSMVWHEGGYSVLYTDYPANASLAVRLTVAGPTPPATFDRLYARAASSGAHLGVFHSDPGRQNVMFVRTDGSLARAGTDRPVGRGSSGARNAVFSPARREWLALFTEDTPRRQPYGLPHPGMRRVRRASELVLRTARVSLTDDSIQTTTVASLSFVDRLSVSRVVWTGDRYAVAYGEDRTITLLEIDGAGGGASFDVGPCTNVLLAADGRGYGLIFRTLGLGNGPDELVFVYLKDGQERARTTIARTPPGVMTITTPAITEREGRFVVAWTETPPGSVGHLRWAELERRGRFTSPPRRLTAGAGAEGWPTFSVGGPAALAYVVTPHEGAAEIHVSFLP